MRSAGFILAALLGIASVSNAANLIQPYQIDCKPGVPIQLEAKEVRANVDGQLDFNTRAYWYKGVPMVPGPTIHMHPGQQCQIEIINNLPTTQNAECQAIIATGHMNMYHCADVTNLHTHG